MTVAGLSIVWLALLAGTHPLLLPDEGRYAGIAWEMLRSGDWLTPTLNGLPYFHKPPLFYWITAASMSLFGVNAWAARAAPLAGAWLAAMALWLFMQRWSGRVAARWALVALLTMPMFYLAAQYANLDMLVAGCITATVLLLADAALRLEAQLPHRGALVSAYAMAALGVLAKGLIGVVLPSLVIVVWLLLLGRWRRIFSLLSLPGLVVFLLLCAPWFVAMQQRFDGFLHYFFVVQHFQRFAEGGFNNAHPWWFYPAVLLLVSLPWWAWLRAPFSIGWLGQDGRRALRLLMLVWIVMIVLFFSLPRSKLVGYVLPVLPPLAFIAADALQPCLTSCGRVPRLWWTSIGLSILLCAGVIGWVSIKPMHSTREIALALRQDRGGDQPVFMLGNYYFDVPLYAGLQQPVAVVDNWGGDTARWRDNWRKELADAGAFGRARARAVLIEPDAFAKALCAQPVAWVIGTPLAAKAYPVLDKATRVAFNGGVGLWRSDVGACR